MDKEDIYKRLTWHKMIEGEHLLEGLGLLVKDSKGEVFEIGDYVYSNNVRTTFYDDGCGCCSDYIDGVEYAFLSELIK